MSFDSESSIPKDKKCEPLANVVCCSSPFRCQQKIRQMRKSLRRTGTQILHATGLELAGEYYFSSHSDFKPRKTTADSSHNSQAHQSTLDRSNKNLDRVHKGRKSVPILFPSSKLLSSMSCGQDWQPDLTCIFCNNAQTASSTPIATCSSPTIVSTETSNNNLQNSPIQSSLTPESPLECIGTNQPKTTNPTSTAAKPAQPKTKRKTLKRYSPAELTAAIDEVEKGHVGTRKAAMLYGIPRSTLRNKVGQLQKRQKLIQSISNPKVPPATSSSSDKSKKRDLTCALKRIISRHLSEKSCSPSLQEQTNEEKQENLLRAKRGRYRRYNKGDLDEALKAVKKGSMTVHRAGHFFGIPHSTLEYKIKERGLSVKSDSGDSDSPGKSEPEKKNVDAKEQKGQVFNYPLTHLLTFPYHSLLVETIASGGLNMFGNMFPFSDYQNSGFSTGLMNGFPGIPQLPFRPWINNGSDGELELQANSGATEEPLNLVKEESI